MPTPVEQRRVVLGWIYARHFYKKHRQIIDRRHPGTGMWILRDTGFMKWFSDTDFQILWGHGIRKYNILPHSKPLLTQ